MTMVLKCSIEMRSMSYAWRGLKEQLGEEIDDKISAMRFLKGKMVGYNPSFGKEGWWCGPRVCLCIWPISTGVGTGVLKYQYRNVHISVACAACLEFYCLGSVSGKQVPIFCF